MKIRIENCAELPVPEYDPTDAESVRIEFARQKLNDELKTLNWPTLVEVLGETDAHDAWREWGRE